MRIHAIPKHERDFLIIANKAIQDPRISHTAAAFWLSSPRPPDPSTVVARLTGLAKVLYVIRSGSAERNLPNQKPSSREKVAMSKWIITAHTFDPPPAMRTLSEVEGDEAKALKELHAIISTYNSVIKKVTRREIYRYSERQYLVRIYGNWNHVEYFIQLGELCDQPW